MITGRPGVGKTTVLKRILEHLEVETGGFYTQELRENRKRVGFELVTLSGEREVMAHVDIGGSPKVGKYGVDLRVIEDLGVREVRRALEQCQLVVIDEVGKMELFSQEFEGVVVSALDSPKAVLATVGLGTTHFTKKVKRRADVEIYEIDPQNRERIWRTILSRIVSSLKVKEG